MWVCHKKLSRVFISKRHRRAQEVVSGVETPLKNSDQRYALIRTIYDILATNTLCYMI